MTSLGFELVDSLRSRSKFAGLEFNEEVSDPRPESLGFELVDSIMTSSLSAELCFSEVASMTGEPVFNLLFHNVSFVY